MWTAYVSKTYLSQHKKTHTILKPVDELNVGNVLIMPASLKTRDITLKQGLCVQQIQPSMKPTLPSTWPMKVHNEKRPHLNVAVSVLLCLHLLS